MTVATLTCMILETITKQNYHISDFSKMWSAFSGLSILPWYYEFHSDFGFVKKEPKLSKSERNSSNYGQNWKIKKADHNLEKLAIW